MLHKYIELKEGWVIRKPYWMSDMEMCHWRFDPVTLAIVAVSVAGGLQAYGQIQAGRAAREQAAMQTAIAERNALLAERQAQAEQEAAAEEAKRQAEAGEELTARQRALFAKTGVEMRGTPLAVIIDTAEKLEADRLMILREGAISAAQARGVADIEKLRGRAAKAKGRAAYRGAKLAAAGTILTTIGTAGYMGSQFGGAPGSRIKTTRLPSKLQTTRFV